MWPELRQACSPVSTNAELPSQRESLSDLMQSLTQGDTEIVPEPEGEEWDRMIHRIHNTGRIHQVSDDTYWYFLEVLFPKWMQGSFFAFAEGQESLTLFWHRGTQHYCRRLTEEETTRFCRASGLVPNYGS